jgi:hypothetical protein
MRTMATDKSQVRAFRLRKNTLAALEAAAAEAGVSTNKAAELVLRDGLARWLEAAAARAEAR